LSGRDLLCAQDACGYQPSRSSVVETSSSSSGIAPVVGSIVLREKGEAGGFLTPASPQSRERDDQSS